MNITSDLYRRVIIGSIITIIINLITFITVTCGVIWFEVLVLGIIGTSIFFGITYILGSLWEYLVEKIKDNWHNNEIV